jgi:aspartyl-tRNA(Asn)/glutamyl-tRNA(Gln) amidotransferase subunit A
MEAEPSGIFLARPDAIRDGISLAVKDLFDTAGLTTTYGSAVFADNVPAETAAAVERLESAGYANVGKTNLHEFAYGVTSQNPHYGTVPNPLAAGRIAGGSSGGSAAAVAAGLAQVGLGSDSGGSIRIPAACCGVVGFKPTWDTVPLHGCFPLAPTWDHAGPLAADVATCAAAFRALAPGSEAVEVSLSDLRVALAWTSEADALVRERVEAAAALFAQPVEVDLPFADELSAGFMREVAEVHREVYAEYADVYGAGVAQKIERCLAVTDAEYEAALRARERYRELTGELLEPFDVLVTPTLGFVAPRLPLDELGIRERMIRFTYPFNALGRPALALPCGSAEDGLPASLQLVGATGADELVLAAGEALERRLR